MLDLWEVFVVLIVFTWQIFTVVDFAEQEGLIDNALIHKKPPYDIVIGILSARANSEQRQALRDTWVGYATRNHQQRARLHVKFIIANRPCMIPPQDRLEPNTCEPDVVVYPVLNKDVIAYNVPSGTLGWHFHRGPLGMDFRVNVPVVITHLGVFDSGSDGLRHGLRAVLYDRLSQEEFVSANFTPGKPGDLIGGCRFKKVDQFILPKGFEASIVAENFSESDPSDNRPLAHGGLDSGGGLITFMRVSRFGLEQGQFPESEESIMQENNQYAAGNFIYRAYDPSGEFSIEKLQMKDHESKEREFMWSELLSREALQLEREMAAHSDILLVDAVEVYRNLPRKILQFYKWAADSVLFNFTLKTDDDCFINVDAVVKGIEELQLRGKSRIWWSNFRNAWPVERAGKWREPDYTAAVYPSFACGAGNVLSADLVRWLAQNADSLKTYQGEDVSMGIWLAALGPNFVKDYHWFCGRECHAGMYSSPENDPEELRELWDNLQKYGDPCGSS